MEIEKQQEGDKLKVKLIGRLDAVTAIQLDKSLKTLEGVKLLTINCGELKYVASAGLRILLKLQKKMNEQGEMKVINVNREVREVLDMTGFSRLLSIEEPNAPKKLTFNF
jgi:anti-sigma B factor antagonist